MLEVDSSIREDHPCRRQEIVFIGTDPMDEAKIRRELNACLVPGNKPAPEAWAALPDTFPSWGVAA